MNPIEHRPDVFLLPMALPSAEGFGTLDPEVLARRLPDFLQLLINRGEPGPTGLLEIQSPPDGGHAQWVTLRELPDPDEAFSMLPATGGEAPRALVFGQLSANEDIGALAVELEVHKADEVATGVSTKLRATVPFDDPVDAMVDLAGRLAEVLDLPAPLTGELLTGSASAFFCFLDGLDGAALISGDLTVDTSGEVDALLEPFTDALQLDAGFGLALRTVHLAIASALDGDRMAPSTCCAVLDRCLATRPLDGDACVAIAEQLAVLGEDQRARDWLEHAVGLESPPARGLESLGIVLANAGETTDARDLWLRGLEVDGHPDFFAHLSRLAFAEDAMEEAWDKVIRGLHRIHERTVRASEWGAEDQGVGVLLRYLVEHLRENPSPPEVIDGLVALAGYLQQPEDRVDLGLCFIAIQRHDLARVELLSGLDADLDPAVRDQAVRGVLMMDVPDFEQRFLRAADRIQVRPRSRWRHQDLASSVREMSLFLDHRADFWPAQLYLALAAKAAGEPDEALDRIAEVLRYRAGQPDACHQMAELFDERGNPKRALECIEQALDQRIDDAELFECRARYLERLDRPEDALHDIDRAIELDPADGTLKKRRRTIQEQLRRRARPER